MLIYMLKSGACLAIFLLFYKLFLENENMHVFKRFYLLAALLLSLIIPAIVFTEYVEIPETNFTTVEHIVTSNEVIEVPTAVEAEVFDIEPLLWTVYFLGMLFFGVKFLSNLFQIFNRIRNNPKQRLARFTQVLLQETFPPHTFFSYIFLNRKKLESKEIPKEVLLHEETHAEQKHSWDVVFVELLHVIFWINPFVYLTKKAIKLNHEFLADQAVLKRAIDQNTYQNTLLSYLSPDSQKKYQPSLPNAINYSSIKKRFTVMKKQTSKKSVVLRSLLLLPLFAILLFSFSEKKEVFIESSTNPVNANIESTAKTELSDFEILVTNTEKGIKLNCIDGCAWTELEFTLEKEQQQLLDKFGMVTSQNNKLEKEITSDDFMISLQKREKEIVMRGVNGTAWIDLSFTLDKSKSQKIDQFGMVTSTQGGATVEQNLKGNDILILINKNGQLLLQGNKLIALNDLKSYLLKFNKHLSKEEREKVVRVKIVWDKNKSAPKNVVASVESILKDYGVATIDIVGPENFSLATQDGASKKQISEFNKLAKHYNEMDSFGMNIKKKEVERLKYIYDLMSDKQRAGAEPFPDLPDPPPPPSAPRGIDGEAGNIPQPPSSPNQKSSWTVTGVANRDSRQGKNGPPLPPVAPPITHQASTKSYSKALKLSINNYHQKNKALETAVDAYVKKKKGNTQDLWNLYNEAIELYVVYYDQAKKEGKLIQPFQQNSTNSSDPPPTPPSAPKVPNEEGVNVDVINPKTADYKALYDSYSAVYLGGKKITYAELRRLEKAGEINSIKIIKKTGGENSVVLNDIKFPPAPPVSPVAPISPKTSNLSEKESAEVEIHEIIANQDPYDENGHSIFIKGGTSVYRPSLPPSREPNHPPSTPEPMAPLDHVIEMAKKGATFYYEGKEISSDKAIKILKENDQINVDSRGSNNKQPVVKLTKQGITIEN